MVAPDPGGGADVASSSRLPSQDNTQSQTRAHRRSSPSSKEDALRLANGTVNQLSKARTHLAAKGYLAQGADTSYLGLALILFQMATETKLPSLADNIKSVAFLLEALSIDLFADRLFNTVENKLNVVIESLALTAVGLDDQQQEMIETAAVLTNAGTQLVETNEAAARTLVETTDELKARMESFAHSSAPASGVTDQPDTRDPFSYAAVTQRHIPSSHASALAKNDERARQVVIQPSPDIPEAQSLRTLSELELVSKAMLAFESINAPNNPAPEGFRFVGARKLTAGNIMLDLISVSAARWLKQPDIRTQFMQHFSATSVLKDFEFRALAEFVPTTFILDAPSALTSIEENSGAPTGGLTRAEWAKLPERRHLLQRLAHLKLYFNSPEAANYAICHGLYIAGKKVGVRKIQQEPQRCAKCQRYGYGNNEGEAHFAKDCKWQHDTCGGCGQHHRRNECMANLTTDSFCVNCGTKGHTVWDRNCPVFLERCKKFGAMNKEGNFPFFVTCDSSTWDMALSNPASQDEGQDGWMQVPRRGTSGRGSKQYSSRTAAPTTLDSGRTSLREGTPATSTNRTELGTTNRYKQLTFEETAQRRQSRSSSRNRTPASSQVPAGTNAPAASTSMPSPPNIHGSFIDLLSPNSRPKGYIPVTPPRQSQVPPST